LSCFTWVNLLNTTIISLASRNFEVAERRGD
jgi:hypothetical protein